LTSIPSPVSSHSYLSQLSRVALESPLFTHCFIHYSLETSKLPPEQLLSISIFGRFQFFIVFLHTCTSFYKLTNPLRHCNCEFLKSKNTIRLKTKSWQQFKTFKLLTIYTKAFATGWYTPLFWDQWILEWMEWNRESNSNADSNPVGPDAILERIYVLGEPRTLWV
jgi:hypothetical protein